MFTQEKNMEVYRRLVAGDASARDEMIEGNLPLVVVKVNALLAYCPQLEFYRQDLVSEGNLALVQAVDSMAKKGGVENARPTGYLYSAIEQGIGDYAQESRTIPVTTRVKRWHEKQGKPVKEPQPVSETAATAAFSRLDYQDPHAAAELLEEIEACCETDRDKRIVRMLMEGNTLAECAAALDCSTSTVWLHRQRIYDNFLARCPEYQRD